MLIRPLISTSAASDYTNNWLLQSVKQQKATQDFSVHFQREIYAFLTNHTT